MYTNLFNLWKQSLKSTGVPYFLNFLATYRKNHRSSNFAGNLSLVKDEYLKSSGKERKLLSARFDAIIDNLVMKNGVKKTTYSMRHNRMVSAIFSEKKIRIEKDKLKVLDIPSSVGTSSLDIYEILSQHYKISSYVLGDLYLKIYYDAERACIYDEEGNLLQTKLRKQFFDIYRPLVSGDTYNIVTDCLLLPVNLRSWYLKKKYRFREDAHYHPIMLLHPDVERKLNDGIFSIRKIDVFEEIKEKFDMIISFNLLQKNYFPRKLIQRGKENLVNALSEGGLLIMGNTVSFSVSMKNRGELLLIEKRGDF
jgi:hypothetical protein